MDERIVDLDNESESQVFAGILDQEGIPYYVRSNHDTVYDGVYQLERGWGFIVAPGEYRDRINLLFDEFKKQELIGDLPKDAPL
jgi:hypothetical protein